MEKTNVRDDGNDDNKSNNDGKKNGENNNNNFKEQEKTESKTPKGNITPQQSNKSTNPASRKGSVGVKSLIGVGNEKSTEPVQKESEDLNRTTTPALPISLSRSQSKSSAPRSASQKSGSQSQGRSKSAPRSPTRSPSRNIDPEQQLGEGPSLDYVIPESGVRAKSRVESDKNGSSSHHHQKSSPGRAKSRVDPATSRGSSSQGDASAAERDSLRVDPSTRLGSSQQQGGFNNFVSVTESGDWTTARIQTLEAVDSEAVRMRMLSLYMTRKRSGANRSV
jgi:hypothetical protein